MKKFTKKRYDDMTNDEINSSIAKCCGSVYPPKKAWARLDYCRDLNAMHKAELTLWQDEVLFEKYRENLENEYLRHVGCQGPTYWFAATSYVRAVAFLKTVGKHEKTYKN